MTRLVMNVYRKCVSCCANFSRTFESCIDRSSNILSPISQGAAPSLHHYRLYTDFASSPVAPTLTKDRAKSLILKLTDDERSILAASLKEFEAERRKEEYKGQLAAFRWRSKFGRPAGVPNLGDVDPTGSYCPVPEDWLLKKYAETVPKPTTRQLFSVAIVNAVPFVGFGFLDNAIMIVCGDYIEATLGSVIVMSTMAAAALGNTFSDVMGLGSAYYVELAASKIGIKPPPLSPIQLDMSSSRLASNLSRFIFSDEIEKCKTAATRSPAFFISAKIFCPFGLCRAINVTGSSLEDAFMGVLSRIMKNGRGRVIGVTIGCILGMTPLLFINKEPDSSKEKAAAD